MYDYHFIKNWTNTCSDNTWVGRKWVWNVCLFARRIVVKSLLFFRELEINNAIVQRSYTTVVIARCRSGVAKSWNDLWFTRRSIVTLWSFSVPMSAVSLVVFRRIKVVDDSTTPFKHYSTFWIVMDLKVYDKG